MFGLPQSTEVNCPMPKAQLYKKFELKQAQRDVFDALGNFFIIIRQRRNPFRPGADQAHLALQHI